MLCSSCCFRGQTSGQTEQVWSIGTADRSAGEFALAPDGYRQFLAADFGFEDRYFLVGKDRAEESFPYVLPGPADEWGGTSGTAGWRTHEINILFGLKDKPGEEGWALHIGLLDNAVKNPPLMKVTVNGQSNRFQLPEGLSDSLLIRPQADTDSRRLTIHVRPGVVKQGGNRITLSVLQGSWVLFDYVTLEGPRGATLVKPEAVFIRNVEAAACETEEEWTKYQPLLVELEHLDGNPELTVELDGKTILTERIDTGYYQLEAPMPAVQAATISRYRILADGKVMQEGKVTRSPQTLQTLADYVDTRIGTAHSRWMIAPGPWMPFSMVKLSPDNQNKGWQAGYQPSFESIGCFSHIHEWTMAGLGMMPTNGPLQTAIGDEADPDSGYRSRIDKSTEAAPIGYYKATLADYGILAELTATTRCSFQRYTFPPDRDSARIIVDFHIPAEYDYQVKELAVSQVSDTRIEGFSRQLSRHVWSRDASQEYTLHFVIETDQPIQYMGRWDTGLWLAFNEKKTPVVQVRTGISPVSIANASENLEKEISNFFGWNFERIAGYHKFVWNELLERVRITTNNRFEKVRFYTNMYRSLCRNTWSDVNGQWVSADGKVRRGSPADLALGCDAFWNTFWNLNQFWNLVTPEWSSRWVKSQLAMYDANGWLAKGPAGMKYIPVMVAEHEIPLIVSAWQMGIRDFDAGKAFEAVRKMQTTPGQKVAGGYAGNRDLAAYLAHKYVPADKGRFSNTLEYAFDDWTVAQFAKALGKEADYRVFSERASWWKNAINPDNGYAHTRGSNGRWTEGFNPFHSGANHQYVEGNAWQLTFFVPQDIPALAAHIGKERFAERLEWGFEASEPWRYNAPNDQYWDYPVVQGNQQSMHFAFLFNHAGKPWLTQKWSRSIIERYYGIGLANAYLGDEDQGQMSAWLVMASLGLFQTDGGCSAEPVYEIASPLYPKAVINLRYNYGRGASFTIEARNASRKNKYIQSAILNGSALNSFKFPASELLKGGTLLLEMGDSPNTSWGIQ
ncbi:MAG: GH92 family glycosyl hydrolase [Tannerellaceae bacterium]|jgi:predicted alpha-1,2-mannosidase|nr:GH92 family glycosyl hydrolase [Tannerellaceae bacterium]